MPLRKQGLSEEKSRTLNLIKSLLDGFFPEFTGVFKDPSGGTALSVLSSCPLPKEIAGMEAERFLETVRERHLGNHLMRKKLLALHDVSKVSLGIDAGAEMTSLELSLLVNRLRLLNEQVEDMERILKGLVDGIEDSKYLLSIVGLGYITVGGMLAELGPLRQYSNGKQLIKMAGTNPTESESAGKAGSYTPMSKKGRPGLRWCIWSAAISLLRHNPDFRFWAKEKRERPAHAHPLKKREAIGAIGNRLLRLAYTLVKKQEFYHMPVLANVAN